MDVIKKCLATVRCSKARVFLQYIVVTCVYTLAVKGFSTIFEIGFWTALSYANTVLITLWLMILIFRFALRR